MKKRYQIALAIASVAIFGVILWPLLSLREPVYQGKSLGAWFYGSNTTFFYASTRHAAKEAIEALGTNAFPFLLSNLKETRGNGPLYNKAYRVMPAWIKRRLPYPVSGDDIKAITLDYLGEIREDLDRNQLDALIDCVPSLRNPRLKMRFLQSMRGSYEADPTWVKLHKTLLDDDDLGIRLEAAICLAECAVDGGKPKSFPVLLSALQSRKNREAWRDIQWYSYQSQPPSGSGIPARMLDPGHPGVLIAGSDAVFRMHLRTALRRLEHYLTPEEKARLRQAEKAQAE